MRNLALILFTIALASCSSMRYSHLPKRKKHVAALQKESTKMLKKELILCEQKHPCLQIDTSAFALSKKNIILAVHSNYQKFVQPNKQNLNTQKDITNSKHKIKSPFAHQKKLQRPESKKQYKLLEGILITIIISFLLTLLFSSGISVFWGIVWILVGILGAFLVLIGIYYLPSVFGVNAH